MNDNETRDLMRRVEALERQLALMQGGGGVRGNVDRFNFDAHMGGVTLTKSAKKLLDIPAASGMRIVSKVTVKNKATGQAVCVAMSPSQAKRYALRFAQLPRPTRTHWKGKKHYFAQMRELFAVYQGIARNNARTWEWATDNLKRRQIAEKIAAYFEQTARM